MFGGFSNGGILNMGAPEVIVIGAVAWVVLGPKELFKLAKQAGEFVGQWQQLGQQAKDTFTSAIEEEIAKDEGGMFADATAAAAAVGAPMPEWAAPPPPAPEAGVSSSSSNVSSIPSLADYSAARDAEGGGGVLSAEDEAALQASLIAEMGDPESNRNNFMDQISGSRNDQIMSEYPADLSAEDAAWALGSEGIQPADEALLATKIEQAENEVMMLQAERTVLKLKREQLEARAADARLAEEERSLNSEMAAEAEEATGQGPAA